MSYLSKQQNLGYWLPIFSLESLPGVRANIVSLYIYINAHIVRRHFWIVNFFLGVKTDDKNFSLGPEQNVCFLTPVY